MAYYLDELKITPNVVTAILNGEEIRLSLKQETRQLLEQEYKYLASHLQAGNFIYGVNTGFGKNVSKLLNEEEMKKLQSNLSAYLDCSVGELQPYEYSRLAFLARLKHICSGGVCVRVELVDFLVELFNRGIAPAIKKYGSLGASGDLTTMAPLARLAIDANTLCWLDGEVLPLSEFYDGELPGLEGRDALALMNGLSNAVSIAAVEIEKMRNLFNLSLASIGVFKFALSDNFKTESPELNNPPVRNFYGQSEVAGFLFRHGSSCKKKTRAKSPVQDEYSLRCMPQILGPVLESFKQAENWVYSEMNSQSDNPLIKKDDYYSGGNFYGGYLTFASDHLAICIAKFSELLDRQTFHLVGGSKGLPTNLIKQKEGSYFHGLKGVHQLSNSLLMNIIPDCQPFSLYTRSCESHNQDMVSNCSNAWNRIAQVREKFGYLAASHLILSVQALDMIEKKDVSPLFDDVYKLVRSICPFVAEDIPLSVHIEKLTGEIQSRKVTQGVF